MLIFALCGVAHADDALEQWRGKASSIRQLAENDIARAYAEVGRLQAELPADATPSDRVRLLNLLARIENYQGETEISSAHAQQAFDLAKQHDDKAGQAEADITIALDAVNRGDIDAMIAADTHSLIILDGVDRPDLLAEAMLRGSMMYNRLEMLEESVAIAVEAMEIAKRSNDDWVRAYAYQGMAVAYDLNGNHAEARGNYAEMLKHAKAAHSKILEGSALNGMGAMLYNLGDRQGGERLIRSAVDLDRAVGGPFYLSRSLFLLAEHLNKQGRFAEALPLLDEAVAIYRQRSNKIGLWWALFKRSEIYQNAGKKAQADADAQDAYRLAEEIKFPVYLSKSARQLSVILAAQGDYRQAYRFGKEADELSGKVASGNAGKRMLELAKRYESESKQREIDKLNRRNHRQETELRHQALEQRWLWTVLGGSVIMLAGAAFFLIRLRFSHRRLKALNTEVLQAKNKLQATLDTIPDLMFEVGPDGRYYDCHSPQSDLLVAPAEDLLAKTVSDVMPTDAAAVCLASLNEAHQHGRSFGKQLLLPLPHGDCWFELSVARKAGEEGEEPRFIVMSRDITERKRMEATALQREQEFRVLVENSPDLIFRYDKDCRRIYANPAVARLVGKPSDALLNSTPSQAKILSDEEADKLMRMIRQVLATGRPAESEVACFGADGQLHYFHNRYAPEFNAHGEAVGVISIARDITERKHADSTLRESEQRYRLVFENSPVSIWEEDFSAVKTILDGLRQAGVTDIEAHFDRHPETVRQCAEQVKIIDVNQAALTLHAAANKEGLFAGLVDTFTPESFATFRQELIGLWHGETQMQRDAVVKTLAGESRHVTVHFTICPGYEESLSKALVSIIDITERKLVEAALVAREREFRTLAESLPDNVVRYDREGRVTYVNPVLEKTLGAIASKMLGATVRERFPNGDYDDYALLLDTVLAGGENGEIEKIVAPPYSDLHLVHSIRMVAERDENGEVISALAIGRDITERKLAENALRESEEKYRTLIEKIQTAVIVHGADTQILVSNPVAQQILGLTADQLHGKTAIDPAWHFHHEDGRLLTQEEHPVNQVLASGKALKNCVLGVHRPDRQEKVWALVNADPVLGKDGAIIQVIVTFIDITQRKRAERELVLLNRAMNTSSDAAFLMDEQGRFVYVNDTACRSLGYSREELIGMSPVDIDPDMTEEIYRHLLSEVFSIGPHLGTIESRHRNRDGRIFPVELGASVIELDGAKFCLSMARDIGERKQAEHRLWLMDFALNQVGEALYIVDISNHNFISVNDEACRALGYSRDELLTMSVLDIDADCDAEEMQQIQRDIDAADVSVFERRHKTKDGRIFAVEINSKVFDYEGRPTCIALARDITERKRAEHEIALMGQALDSVHEAAYLADENACFIYVNNEACRELGYSRDELLAMTVMDMAPGWTLDGIMQLRQNSLAGVSQLYEGIHRRKDGSTFPVEVNSSPCKYGDKIYGLSLARNITERKQVEHEIRSLNAGLEQRVLERTEELRRQTRYLRTLIDTLPMLAWLKDKDCRFLVVNQAMASACALSVDDMVGKSDLDCWANEYAESYRAVDAEVMATNRRKIVEESFVDAANNIIWVETFKAPILDVDGSVLGTVGIARDIGDRRAMELARDSALAEAERLAQLRSEFMARMSHELRTPLNGIMGYAQILLRENGENERQGAMLRVILQSGEYLLNLINDILDFAKIEAGKLELSLSDIQLPRFLSNLASIITVRAEQKGLAFVCDIAANVPAGIRADDMRLRQVLLNLLSNAVKYSEQGQISLRVIVLEPDRLRFEVQDEGIGIDAGQLETIFQAFEQAGDWQHRTGGTGLGLPISRELVRLMGSDIHVVSRIGKGSTFWFDLDVSMVEVRGEIIADEHYAIGYQGLRRRVLVVDDVDENRSLLIDILSRLGFETVGAANGRECLDSVKAQLPDLVLLDMVMPEMDGMETARRLRGMPGFGQTPIIAISASAYGADVTEAISAGVNVFLPKPVDIKRLKAQIAVLLKLDWTYASAETKAPQLLLNEALVVPPLEQINVLYRLAKEGCMRDIIRQADHLEELDQCYSPFAAKLRDLAQGYQSKAILDLVEHYIDRA